MKRIWLLVAFLLVACLILPACAKQTEPTDQTTDQTDEDTTYQDYEQNETETNATDAKTRNTLLCYSDENGYLIPVMVKIPWEEGIAKAALNRMINTKEQKVELMTMGLNALLPGETKIMGLSIKDGLAKVDFNSSVLNCVDAVTEKNMVDGVVMTLTSFPSIKQVQFLVNGKVVDKLTHGTDISKPMQPKAPNLEKKTAQGEDTETSAEAEDNEKLVTVFFPATSSTHYNYLVPVSRYVETDTVETAIKELVKGPAEGGSLKNCIPEGTEVAGVQMESGVLYVNFTQPFSTLKDDPVNEMMVMRAIAMTAKDYSDVQDVKVLVDGKDYDYNISMPTFANEYN